MIRRAFLQSLGLATAAFSQIALPEALHAESNTSSMMPLKHKPTPDLWRNDTVTAAWIGHSTILINMFGTVILTDPVFSRKIGIRFLGATIGVERMTSTALMLEEIPKPEIVLLSHAHMDHCDYPTLAALTEQYPGTIDAICAYNTADVIDDLQWKSLTTLDWNNTYELHGIMCTAMEVLHFGWRYPWEDDRRRGQMKRGRSYNAYMLEKNGKTVVFGGDMAMHPHFKKYSSKSVDLAFMPIGAYDPWVQNHCNPEEAIAMAQHFNAKAVAPMHCMTFKQSNEPFAEPILRFLAEAERTGIIPAWKFIGETYTVES